MPTGLPTRCRATELVEQRTLVILVAAICALMGLALVEPAFTDTAVAAECSDIFRETAAY